MSDWSSRAEAYRNAPEQREGEDLDLIVRWAEGSETALDVATGGGHVARRLREAGVEVVSADINRLASCHGKVIPGPALKRQIKRRRYSGDN